MIQIQTLNKFFDTLKANDNINLNIKKGEIFGLLGPNGAGKSTLINTISTLIKPDSGTIIIDGINSIKNPEKIKQILGVVPQEISLYDHFSAYDNLLFFGKLYQIETSDLKQRIDKTLQLIGLENRKNDLIKTFSGGMKRRINIAAALLHEPKILLMDEPTVGVDPQSRNQIFEVIENLNKQGLTIIYTTHYMEEVERLCDTIAIMDNGKVITQGSLAELQEKNATNEKMTFKFENINESQKKEFQKAFQFSIYFEENTMTVQCPISENLNNILTYCLKSDLKIIAIEQEKANLESIFLTLTGKSLRD